MSDEQKSGAEAAVESAAEASLPGPDLACQARRGRPPIRTGSMQIILLAALAVFTPYIAWRAKSLEKPMAGRDEAVVAKPAPRFSLASLDGRTISLSDYAGKKVVVSYWASWCGPCKVEMPELRDFYRRYHQTNSDFEILAISIDEDRSEAERYAAREKLPFPVLLDPESKTADAYSVEGIPTMFVVGTDGTVEYAHTGLEEGMEILLMRRLGISFPGTEPVADRSLKRD